MRSSEKRAISARASLFTTIRRLWPHMWPSSRADLKRRVLMAFGLLVAAKLVTIAVPFSFKWAVDALVAVSEGKTPAPGVLPAVIYLPVALVLAFDLRAHARALAPLPPRAQNRRADARPRAWPQWHRGTRAACDSAARAHDLRSPARGRAACLLFRLALCGRSAR